MKSISLNAITFAFVVFMLLFQGVLFAVDDDTGMRGRMRESRPERAIPSTDASILSNFRGSLGTNSTLSKYSNDLTISSNNKVMTLSGKVPNDTARRQLEEMALNSGARSVTNNVQVAPQQ